MKATVKNLNDLLADLQFNSDIYFKEVRKIDNNNIVCVLTYDYWYDSNLSELEEVLEENFDTYLVDGKLILTSK